MTQPDWKPLQSGIVVLARPAALWTRAVDYVAGVRKLKITVATGLVWTAVAGANVGADGDPGLPQNPNAPPLLPSALIGALIGKIGGSAADNTAPVVTIPGSPATAGTGVPTPFSVGSFCIIELTAGQKGSLFLTMNDAPAAFGGHTGQLTVDLYEAL